MQRITQLMSVQEEARELFESKNKDYGDAFARYGPVGVLVRVGDKLARLQHITQSGVAIRVEDESVRDTLLDLHNYSAMAIMLMDENKPRPLRAWRLPSGAMQLDGSNEVIVREKRDGNGTIQKECSCSSFTKEKFCIHTESESLAHSNYQIISREAA